MTNKLLIGIAAVIVVGFAALFGGVLDRPAGAPPDGARVVAVGRGLQGRLRAQRERDLRRRQPPGDARREQGRPAQLDAARPRLRAARPRDRRPGVLRQGRRCAESRARARRRRPARDQRPRLARALAPPFALALGLAYQQRARETGDPSCYAQGRRRTAARPRPRRRRILSRSAGSARSRSSRHRFRARARARPAGARARPVRPRAATA